jgi:SOS response regulatory protein OraA/RecX
MKLNEQEVRSLINQYKSELRKLDYQKQAIKSTIAALKEDLKTAEPAPIKENRQKRGVAENVMKSETTDTLQENLEVPEKKPKRKYKKNEAVPQKKIQRQRKLNGFDQCVISSIRENGKIMINSELMAALTKYVEENNIQMEEDQIRAKLNQTLQKLANKRKMLAKATYPGKGFAYGLVEWLNKRGNIATQYRR